MRLHSASQNGEPMLARPCDYTAHKGLLFLLSEAPTSSRRPGAPGAACESPSVEDPEPNSARRRFPPGYLRKELAVAPGPREYGGGGGGDTSLCALSCHFLQPVRYQRRTDLRWEGALLSRLSSAQLSRRLAVCSRALHSVPHLHRSLRSGVNGRYRVNERGLT